MLSRRDIIKSTGVLIVSIQLPLLRIGTQAQADHLPDSLENNLELDAWLALDSDDKRVVVFMGKVEIGQGILTSLMQIVAEELDLAMDKIKYIEVDTDQCPEEFLTAGSLSIQQSGSALRIAAARARQILISMAAKRFKRREQDIGVVNGLLSLSGQLTDIDYWQVLEGNRFNISDYNDIKPKHPHSYKMIGKSVQRVDIPAKVRGDEIFIHDVRIKGMLHARLVRPPRPGSVLQLMNSRYAEKIPGVKKIIQNGSFLALVADKEATAINAAEILKNKCQWKGGIKLPDEGDLSSWLKSSVSESNVIAEKGRPASHNNYSAEYTRPFLAHASLSPSIGLAHFSQGKLKVWSHSQGVFDLRNAIAEATGLAKNAVQVVHRQGCGCYGHNNADDAGYDAALIALAMPGKPIRLQYSRDDEFRWEPFGSAMAMRIEASLDSAGLVSDWQHDLWSCTHSSRPAGSGLAGNLLSTRLQQAPLTAPPAWNMQKFASGGDRNAVPLYSFQNMKVTKHFISEMPIRVSALRSLGAFANVFAIESFMDELAFHARQDPIDFRIRHLQDERAIRILVKMKELMQKTRIPANMRIGKGIGFAQYKNSAAYCAVAMYISIDNEGNLQLEKGISVTDAGLIINPDGVKNQIEGGIIQAAGWSLSEKVKFNRTQIQSLDWMTYPVLKFSQVPELETVIINRVNEKSLGVGESSLGPTAAAIANAIFDAVGKRQYDLPIGFKIAV